MRNKNNSVIRIWLWNYSRENNLSNSDTILRNGKKGSMKTNRTEVGIESPDNMLIWGKSKEFLGNVLIIGKNLDFTILHNITMKSR